MPGLGMFGVSVIGENQFERAQRQVEAPLRWPNRGARINQRRSSGDRSVAQASTVKAGLLSEALSESSRSHDPKEKGVINGDYA
jgi:hypothetical protein